MNDQARTQGGCPGTVAAASIAPSTITPIVNGLSTARRAMTPAQTIAPNPLSKCLDFWGTVQFAMSAGPAVYIPLGGSATGADSASTSAFGISVSIHNSF